MNSRYKATAIAIKQAEQALETLKDFSESQYKAKGETMLEQIIDYISNVLYNANYMCCGCCHYNLKLINMKNRFVFYIDDSRTLGGGGYPIFSISINGDVKYIRKLEEWMMLVLVKEWNGFKEDLNFSIKTTMKERTKSINNQLVHIGYVNEQLAKWKV